MSSQLKPAPYSEAEPDGLRRRAMRIMNRTRSRKEKFFDNHEDLVEVIEHLRAVGCVIVLTMGTWDMIHEGHADYIELGKEEAKKLYPNAEQVIQIVAVDSDELTRQRKGPKRPVVKERERLNMMSHIESVDIVAYEHQLGYFHRHIPHEVRVISTSTTDLKADEETAKYCARLINLPPQAETSTSARIRLLILEGGQEVFERFREGIERLIKEVEDGFKV